MISRPPRKTWATTVTKLSRCESYVDGLTGVLLSVLLSGCTASGLTTKARDLPATLSRSQELAVRGHTNAPEAAGPVCTVYSLGGKSLGGYGPARNGRYVDYSFELPAGTYDLVFEEPSALRKVVRVEYRAGSPMYDFTMDYGDLDGNGMVDEGDIARVRKWQGSSFSDIKQWEGLVGSASEAMSGVSPSKADFNGDLVVDGEDLRMALESVGRRADPLPMVVARSKE